MRTRIAKSLYISLGKRHKKVTCLSYQWGKSWYLNQEVSLLKHHTRKLLQYFFKFLNQVAKYHVVTYNSSLPISLHIQMNLREGRRSFEEINCHPRFCMLFPKTNLRRYPVFPCLNCPCLTSDYVSSTLVLPVYCFVSGCHRQLLF